jgi:hypothetical protein
VQIPSRADDHGIGPGGLPLPAERERRRAIYARILPRLELLGWQLGYTLARHGSGTRDLDLVAVPWIAAAADPNHLVRAVCDEMGPGAWYRSPALRPHGRLAWSIHFGTFENAHLYVDLSVMPRGA